MVVAVFPSGFRIRSRSDALVFYRDYLSKGATVVIYQEDEYLVSLVKDTDGNVLVHEKYGVLNDPFNPTIEVAHTGKKFYKNSVIDYVWKYRKYINRSVLG